LSYPHEYVEDTSPPLVERDIPLISISCYPLLRQ
jgi:hypothetical protein